MNNDEYLKTASNEASHLVKKWFEEGEITPPHMMTITQLMASAIYRLSANKPEWDEFCKVVNYGLKAVYEHSERAVNRMLRKEN